MQGLLDDAKIRRRMLGVLGAEAFERTEKAILGV